MQAVTYRRYGPPSALSIDTLPTPKPRARQLLVRVHASSVTTADWRVRAAAFPGVLQVPGRLMFGLCAPRNPVLGGDFAGLVESVGPDVTTFQSGDRVMGFSVSGAHAEYLTIDQNAAVAHLPAEMRFEHGAALPFGALSALVFLRDFAQVQPGQRVLVIGGSGGVGAYAIQIARALGAQVTGVASTGNQELMRELGASDVRDYRAGPFLHASDGFDVILDTVGAVDFAQARPALTRNGVFVPLNFGVTEMMQAAISGKTGKRIKIGVSGDTQADLETLMSMVQAGTLRPVVDQIYPMEQAVQAHAHVEGRHRKGAVILDMQAA
ncbi:MAG: NAD(P)-dependent alcohol dehydrogenase [Thalassovita sp.]